MYTKWLLALAVLASSVQCAPSSKARAELDSVFYSKRAASYTFDVYQAEGCTGESDPISGTGTTDCTSGNIENGSGIAFILTYLQSGYTVYLYETLDDCKADASRSDYLDKIDSSTSTNQCYDESENFAAYIVTK